MLEKKTNAAIKIQSFFRGHHARTIYIHQKRAQREEFENFLLAQRQEHERESAQVKIAYLWRRIKKLKSSKKKTQPKKKGVGKRRETMVKPSVVKLSG